MKFFVPRTKPNAGFLVSQCLFVCWFDLCEMKWILNFFSFLKKFHFRFLQNFFAIDQSFWVMFFFGKFFFRLPGWNKHQPNLFWGKFLVFSLPSNPFSWFSGCLFSRKLFFLAKEFSLFYFCWFKNRSTKEKKSILFPFSNRNILFSLSFPFHRRM